MKPRNHLDDVKRVQREAEEAAGVQQHVTPQQRERQQRSPAQRGYDAQWRALRRRVLRERPLCQRCLERGLLVPSQEVDHVQALRRGGTRLDRANLRALCKPCHSRKTVKEDGGFGRAPQAGPAAAGQA